MTTNNKDLEYIKVEGTRVHNLKNISVSIPKNKLTVITGLSGSGKSSLAFDTIYAEGQRRYLESFGVFARQFMGQIERPDTDSITGLSPVISIEQKTISKNPRSTVGTITEVYDFLRLFYARAGIAYSYITGKAMQKYSVKQIQELIYSNFENQKIIVLAPLIRGRKGHYRELFEGLAKQGYIYVRIDGLIKEIKPKLQLDRYKIHNIEVVIDRLSATEKNKIRLNESIENSLKLGNGLMGVCMLENEKDMRWYSKNLMCVDSGISYEEPSPNTFSFNSPFGYCPSCKGLGVITEIDEEAIFPDKDLSINKGGIGPISKNPESITAYHLMNSAKKSKISLTKPIKNLTRNEIDFLLYGDENDETGYEGLGNMLKGWYEESTSDYIREWAFQYLKMGECNECQGTRLKKESLWYKIADKNIADLNTMDIEDLNQWLRQLEKKLNKTQKLIAKDILKEIQDRTQFLLNVGLHYLNLNRPAGTLSGGESQRIRLATQIGSKLTGITYILDEPSIGLHQDDNNKLIHSLQELRDVGNTVIVVEHDKDIMLASDYIIDIGPKAGIYGGEVCFEGTPKQLLKSNTATALHLNHKDNITFEGERRIGNGKLLTIKGAQGNNLKKVDVDFPLGKFICISGLSGSGKSTLITETLYPLLMQHCYKSKIYPQKFKSIEGLENIDKVVEIDQSPIGRTPRSNPATYTGLFGDIRSIFTNLPESKIRGYKPGRFSFNVKGGRCENCKGDGMQKIEMNFLPDVYVECNVCHGKRYNKETLEVRYKGLSISDVLNLSIDDACVFFQPIASLYRKLKTLQDVGLGYITLGQSSTTLSGGEAQRVKLSTELSKRDTGKTFYILDEPTTGLHFHDVKMLVNVLQHLVNKGNTVLVIEHNLDVLISADHIIDLGPGGGKNGGEIIAIGTPEEVAKNKLSLTAKYLSKELMPN